MKRWHYTLIITFIILSFELRFVYLKINTTDTLIFIIHLSTFLLINFLLFYSCKLNHNHDKLKKTIIKFIEVLEEVNYHNDEDTGNHIKRIASYSRVLAKELKLKRTLIREISSYASLHDIGKVAITENILKKPGKLTKEEFEVIKTHTTIGYKLIKRLNLPSTAENIIRYHHEKWDGSGYPNKLFKNDIPIEARVVALADVYDALRMKRIYKEAYSHKLAMDIIKKEKGKHFDPLVVDAFIKKNSQFDYIYKNSHNLKEMNISL